MSDPASPSRRVRSPAYPNIGLEEAVEKVQVLYEREGQGRHPIPVDAIAKDWNYTGEKNGSALAAISAAKQFGLLEEVPDSSPRQLKLTQRGILLSVHTNDEAPERIAALKDAVQSPKLYQSLLEKFPLPLPSDSTLRTHFLIELSFNGKQVAGAIKDFRDSLSFARLQSSDTKTDVPSPEGHGNSSSGIAGQSPQVGDYVQWTSQSAEQWVTPKKVSSISPDGGWVFVVGEKSAAPIAQLSVVEPPKQIGDFFQDIFGKMSTHKPSKTMDTPPFNPDYKPSEQMGEPVKHLLTTDTGPVVVQWPSTLSQEDYETAERWIEGLKKKLKRSVRADELDHPQN